MDKNHLSCSSCEAHSQTEMPPQTPGAQAAEVSHPQHCWPWDRVFRAVRVILCMAGRGGALLDFIH